MLPALPFIQSIQQQGGHVYAVGGTVRDNLLGLPRKDIDILVTGIPQPNLIRLLRQQGQVQLTGRAFGVLKFVPRHWDEEPIDIALPRTEISTGIGHRDFDVSFDHTLPIEIDLGRRDFTINAIAVDLITQQIIDPFGGRDDIVQRQLQQVSDQAFPEDPLRMLRGVQLSARFHLTVEASTQHAMTVQADSITTIAPERIAEELRKLLQATSPASGFQLMHDTSLFAYLFPEIALPLSASQSDQAHFAQALRRLDQVQQHQQLMHPGHLDLLLAALFATRTSADTAYSRLEALRFTTIGANLDRIKTLIQHYPFDPNTLATASALRHFAYQVGPEIAFMLFDLQLADRLAKDPINSITDLLSLRQQLQRTIDQCTPLHLKQLAVNGNDLQRLGVTPGPHMGNLLLQLLHRVLDDPSMNRREILLNLVQQDTSQNT